MSDDEAVRGRAERAASFDLSGGDTIRRPFTSDATLPAPSALEVDVHSLPRISIGERSDAVDHVENDLVRVATLGEGGMGRVILARQRSLAREVAVKTVKEGADTSALAALLREGRVTGALEHPGIIPIHALGIDGAGRPLLVMKRVDGVDWETLLSDPKHAEDPLATQLEILVRVCHTVEFAHSRGVIHRDLKAENIMVGSFGEVYVADWGVATTTGAHAGGDIVGTPAFMAPEMAVGSAVDERTDVYLLGALLHRLLTSAPRHAGRTVAEMVMAAARSEDVAYPETVPAELADLSNAATRRDPRQRLATARVFRERLVAFARNRSAVALCQAALERLGDLEQLLAKNEVPPDLPRAYKAATETRFGLAQCLRSYPEYAPAREASRRCVEAMVELELRQGHAESADALLREIPRPPSELVARVEESRRKAEESARERERLQALERDFDVSVARRERLAVAVVLASVSVVISGFAAFGPREFARGDLRPIAYAGVILVVTLAVAFVLRRRLVTELNRRLVMLLVVVEILILGNRVLTMIHPTPIDWILTTDCLLDIAGLVFASFSMKRVAVALPPFLLALVLLQVFPAHAVAVFGACSSVGVVAMGWAVATARRSAVSATTRSASG